jgi:transcriptional regulator with XRE-family HTH domain
VPADDHAELLRAFGRAVRGLRTERGLSQERLAELAGIHRTYVADVERGERNVGLVNVARLADGLGVDLQTLMGRTQAARRG